MDRTTVSDIIFAVDEPLDATQCGGKQNCHDDGRCMTHELWANLNVRMLDYLDSVTLADLVDAELLRLKPGGDPNARALQRKLQENKFKAYTEVMRSSGAERTRVRVGPYDSREAAEKARQRMRALKLVIGDATVVRQGE